MPLGSIAVQAGQDPGPAAGVPAMLFPGSVEPHTFKEIPMKSLIIAACLTMPAFLAASPAQPTGSFARMIVRKLDLSPAQKQAALQVVQAHRAAFRTEREAAFQARADLGQALVDPRTTPDQIQALEAKASSARLAVELEINQVVKEIAPSLTADQIAKAKQLAQDTRNHIEDFRAWLQAGPDTQTKP